MYASYQYRRDFAETVKAGAKVKDLQLIQKAQAHVGELHFPAMFDEPVQLQIPEMRKSLAWEFALRAAHESETDICTRMLQEEYKTSEVNDVDVVISPTFRNARLVYVPAYAIDYTYGETFNVHGERHPEHFCALVSALGTYTLPSIVIICINMLSYVKLLIFCVCSLQKTVALGEWSM